MLTADFTHNPLTLLHIAGELRKRDIAPVEIFHRAGISPIALVDRGQWIPRAICLRLGIEAANASGDRFFASRIGESFQIADFGEWGRIILRAQTVGEACAVAAGGVRLLHRGSSLRLLEFGNQVRLRFAYHGELGVDPHQHLVGTLAVIRKIALLGDAPAAVGVRLTIPYSRGADCLEDSHGSRLEFGCDHDEIVIDHDILDLPLGGAHAVAVQRTASLLETAEAVGALLIELLPCRRANIDVVAAQLGTSRRTLQRRLADWGFNFEELLDETRHTEALRLLRAGERSAIEIAFLLGYSNPAHFTRAFRRWTSRSPRDYVRRRETGRRTDTLDLGRLHRRERTSN